MQNHRLPKTIFCQPEIGSSLTPRTCVSFLFLEAVGPLRIFGDHLLRILSEASSSVQTSRRDDATFKGYWDVGTGSEGSREEQKGVSSKELHNNSSVRALVRVIVSACQAMQDNS